MFKLKHFHDNIQTILFQEQTAYRNLTVLWKCQRQTRRPSSVQDLKFGSLINLASAVSKFEKMMSSTSVMDVVNVSAFIFVVNGTLSN